MKVRDFSKLYFGLLILHLAVIFRPGSEALLLLSKPALMFGLLAFFIHSTHGIATRTHFWIAGAIGASLVGDILWMEINDSFLPGLMAFAVAQICFLGFYFSLSFPMPGKWAFPAVFVPILLIAFLHQFFPQEPLMYLYGYIALGGFHFIKSVQYAGIFKGTATWSAVGAFLLMVSHLLLIYNHLLGDNKYIQIAGMLSYGTAQFLIVLGLLPLWQRPINKPPGDQSQK